jgi:hypothetical protein
MTIPFQPGARVRTTGMLMPSEDGLIGTIIEADPCCPGHWRVEVGNRIFGRVPERNLEAVPDELREVDDSCPHVAEIPELLNALRYWEVLTPQRDRIASILEWVARQGDQHA